MDTEGNMLRIGESKDIADILLGQNGHIIALKNEEYPTMKEYINGNDEFGADYYFTILAIEPNVGRKLTSLQSDTWRYYAETRLIIEEKTYLKGNRYRENAIFTGDKYIPIKVQKEMMHYFFVFVLLLKIPARFRMMTTMETHIMVEKGSSYVLGGGLYYLDLYLPEEAEYLIEKYGMLRKSYLQEHRKGLYL